MAEAKKQLKDEGVDFDKLSKDHQKYRDAEIELHKSDKTLQNFFNEQNLNKLATAADIAGVIDPTPASDLVAMGCNLANGDYVGAALSVVSLIPWLGDAIAKPIKGVRAVKTGIRLAEKIKDATLAFEKAQHTVKRLKKAKDALTSAQKRAAEIVRKKRIKRDANGNVVCWGTKLPDAGSWSGPRGNSTWTSPDGSVKVQYKDGYPDFTNPNTSAQVGNTKIGAVHQDGMVEIGDMAGNHGSDFTKARDAMRTKTENPYWPGKSKDDPLSKEAMPTGYTWHHHEDGSTMILVDKRVHNASMGGGSHTGGASVVTDPAY